MSEQKKFFLFNNDTDTPLGKAATFVKIALIFIIIFLLVISVNKLMKYSALLERKEEIQKKIDALNEEIDELKYYISSPMDEQYVKKFAKELLGLVPSDEIIYITDGD